MIAAVTAMAVFAFIALEATREAQVALIGAGAQTVRARMSAEADAGFALAAHGLGIADPARRWNAAGDLRTVSFDDDLLTIGVENESGKIPLNFILAPQAERMFELAGAAPAEARVLTLGLIAMREGASASPEEQSRARGAPLAAIDQLALLPEMTPAIYARLAPEVTVDAPTLNFEPRVARPLALAVMVPNYKPSAASAAPQTSIGSVFTVRVDVSDGRGGELRRTAILELTAAKGRPAIVRALD